MSYENGHTKEMKGTDDLFANSSNETVIDNIDFSLVLREADEFLKLNQCLGNQNSLFPISPNKQPRNVVKETMSNYKSKNNLIETFNLSQAVELIVTEVRDTIKQLYCPFCPLYFVFESSLTDHLKACHSKELSILMLSDTAILLHPCPLCNAKFYMKLLLPKHILHNHQQAVILMMQENQNNHFISCQFCSFKVLIRHSKLLLNHMEKKHCVELEHFVKNKFSNESDLSQGKCDKPSNNMLHICSLKVLKQLSNEQCVGNIITNDAKMSLKPILKSSTKAHKSFLDSYGGERSSGVRRKLRFSESDSELSEKVQINYCKDKKKIRLKFNWKFLFKRRKSKQFGKGIKFITSTPFSNSKINKKQNFDIWWEEINSCSPAKRARICSIQNTSEELTDVNSNGSDFELKTLSINNQSELSHIKQFKCAVCLAAYTDNCELLKHVKKEHKGLFNILRPQYRCGECEAKFFKNSFLVRHCKFHHTPLCLKKKCV